MAGATGSTAAPPPVEVRRARIEEIRPLAAEYQREQHEQFGEPGNQPLPPGGVFWLATDAASGQALGYAAGSLRPEGCTIGPIFTRPAARRRRVGEALLTAIQHWAEDTRVPVVEISVAADNPSGLAFLESLGYVPRRILMSQTPIGRDTPAGSASDGAGGGDGPSDGR